MNETATIEIVTERMPLIEINAAAANRVAKARGIPAESVEFVRKRLVASDLQIEEGERAFVITITTDAIDRDNEVLLPSGINLDNYRKNPTVFWAHDHGALPIGVAQWIKETARGLAAKPVLAKRPETHVGNWLADDILSLVRQGVLRTASVGFIPTKWHEPTADDIKARPDLEGVARIYDEWELLEFSIVPVPSNPEALTLAKSMSLGRKVRTALGLGPGPGAPPNAADIAVMVDARMDETDAEGAEGVRVLISGEDGTPTWVSISDAKYKALVAGADVAVPDGADMADRVRELAGEIEEDTQPDVHLPDAVMTTVEKTAPPVTLNDVADRLDTLISRLEIAFLMPALPEDIEIEVPQEAVIELDAEQLAASLKQAFETAADRMGRLPQDRIDHARGVVVIDEE